VKAIKLYQDAGTERLAAHSRPRPRPWLAQAAAGTSQPSPWRGLMLHRWRSSEQPHIRSEPTLTSKRDTWQGQRRANRRLFRTSLASNSNSKAEQGSYNKQSEGSRFSVRRLMQGEGEDDRQGSRGIRRISREAGNHHGGRGATGSSLAEAEERLTKLRLEAETHTRSIAPEAY
jgi:hypothetical protein